MTFIVAALIFTLPFSVISSPAPPILGPTCDYGIQEDLLLAHNREEEYLNNASVLNDTSAFLEEWVTVEGEIEEPSDGLVITTVDRKYPVQPAVIGAAEEYNPEGEYNNLLDLLRNQIRDYYVYVPHFGDDRDWHEGTLTPGNPAITALELLLMGSGDFDTRWVYIDIDDDETDDIRARMNPNLNFLNIADRFAAGGLKLQVEDLGAGWDEKVDYTDVFFLKGFNYSVYIEGELVEHSALLCSKLGFSDVPDHAIFSVHATQIEFALDLAGMLAGDSAEIAEISGPVEIRWEVDEGTPDLSVQVVFIAENETVDSRLQSWFDMEIRPGSGQSYVPTTGGMNASTSDPKMGFNHIKWECPEKVNITMSFCEERDNTTYALIEMVGMPTELEMGLAREVVEYGNITILQYNASSIIPFFRYKEYQYLGTRVGEITSSTPLRHVYMEMENIPKMVYMEGTFDFGEEMVYPNTTMGGGILGTFVNMFIVRIISRAIRIGRTVSSIPDKILSAAGGGGYFLIDTSIQSGFDNFTVSFLLTDRDIPWVEDPDQYFFAFANSTLENPAVEMIVSGRMGGLKHIGGIIGNDTHALVKILGEPDMCGYYVDESRDFISKVLVERIPDEMVVDVGAEGVSYQGTAGDNRLLYTSRQGEMYMQVEVNDLPSGFTMKRMDEGIDIQVPEGSIGEVRLLVTNRTPVSLEGSHIYIKRDPSEMTISLSLRDIAGISYNKSDGVLVLDTEEENTFKMFLSSTGIADEPDAYIKFLVDPLPTHFVVAVPPSLNITTIELPDVSSDEGLLTLPNMLFTISDIGSNLADAIQDALSTAVESMGEFGTSASLSYRSTQSTDITGLLLYGDINETEVSWTHGISLIQEDTLDGRAMAAKIYLPGLPTEVEIGVDTRPPHTKFDLWMKDYSPKYDWLFMDIAGIQGRDARLSLSGIPSPIDINISADISIEMGKGGGELSGVVSAQLSQNGVSVPLGAMHMVGIQKDPIWTQVELLLPQVPAELSMEIVAGNEVMVNYDAFQSLEYVYLSAMRIVEGEISGLYAILHEVPRHMTAFLSPRRDLDIDGSMLQMMPDIVFTASAPTLDAFLEADGEFLGQRGRFQIQITNMSTYIEGHLEGDTYQIRGEGAEYIEMIAQGVPYSKQFNVDTVHLQVDDLQGLAITVEPFFGFFPIGRIENHGTGNVNFALRTELFDKWETNIVLVDLAFRESALGSMPSYPDFLVNGGVLQMEGVPQHMFLVDPGLTVLLTLFSGGWL
ncbi:MAG: hypothetical protein KAT70_01695 [Thermoplasmata archaeon]|nr:hypothetical protein [Thermoplasmata archaeon]